MPWSTPPSTSAATIILLPFANGLEKLAILTIPDDAEKESFALLDERLLNTPAVAVARARSATADMAELARVGVIAGHEPDPHLG